MNGKANMLLQADPSHITYTENLQKFLRLPQGGKIIAEYIWVDSEGGVRSKSRVCQYSFDVLVLNFSYVSSCPSSFV